MQVFRKQSELGAQREAEWNGLFAEYAQTYPDKAREFQTAADRRLPDNWESIWSESMVKFDPATQMATREAQGKDPRRHHAEAPAGARRLRRPDAVERHLVQGRHRFFRAPTGSGRYIRYGVREHGMGAIMNGIAGQRSADPVRRHLLSPLPITCAPLSVSQRCRSTPRSSFTRTRASGSARTARHTRRSSTSHRSEPCPGMIVIRPADANETAYAWKFALEHRQGPVDTGHDPPEASGAGSSKVSLGGESRTKGLTFW